MTHSPFDILVCGLAVLGFLTLMALVSDGLTPYGQQLADRLGLTRQTWWLTLRNEILWRRPPKPTSEFLPSGDRQRVRRRLPRHSNDPR